MKILKKEVRSKEVDAIVDILCNKCGNSMALDEHGCGMVPDRGSNKSYLGLLNGVVDGCFSSDHLLDCHRYNFSMCEQCLVELFNSFKIPPTIGEYQAATDENTGENITWAEDRKIRFGMDDRHDPIEKWECSCSDPIDITVGVKTVSWYRNGMYNHHTEESNGDSIYHLECMNLAGRGQSDDEAYKQLNDRFQFQLNGFHSSGNLQAYLRSPHWKVTKRPVDGWPWLNRK